MSKITVDELSFRIQCAQAWNTLNTAQQERFHCIKDFVEAYCKLVKETYDDDAIERLTTYVAQNDVNAYIRLCNERRNRKQ